MTEQEVRNKIIAWIGNRSLQECADEVGVTKAWVHQMKSGGRRPCGKILDHLGIKRQPRQRPTKEMVHKPLVFSKLGK